ncbi:diaminopimelate epimerase [Pseudoruegeria sp. SHC-113]|uniref:diaminopimelate epimerase n=1 Tax=Pseudoruegeria sp. SHC-113 TaxID=2855439 RepID=UPI0021BA4CCE|nr:diaminopimelate epimerase [Pseudoruegeria sp. SHC-113]MCT8158746.1 diaminopimelate epimerase [Pseudoruegeria sp. SHC-113]
MRDAASSESLTFMKMHGLGNDFVVLDSRGREAVVTESLARGLGDRHRGVGFDQLAEIRSSDVADIDLDFWNSDGSRAGACGNATRCVAQYMMDQLGQDSLTIRTSRGLLRAERAAAGQVAVNMGHPQLDWAEVPLAHETDTLQLPLAGDPVAVGMGNPHCVFFVEDAEAVDVAKVGARFETDPLFPQATNVEFAEVRNDGEIRMRVWERGTGITLACGSGACATAVAAHRRGLTGRTVRMEVDGGWLLLDWREDGVWMTGPTAHVFDATLSRAFLEAL